MKHLVVTFTLIALLISCSPTSPPNNEPAHYSGTLERICSPVDAAGIELRLEKEQGAGPSLIIIQLWGSQIDHPDELITLTDSWQDGFLLRCQTLGDCQTVSPGYLVVQARNQLGPSQGLFWSKDGQIHGSFSAELGEAGPAICG